VCVCVCHSPLMKRSLRSPHRPSLANCAHVCFFFCDNGDMTTVLACLWSLIWRGVARGGLGSGLGSGGCMGVRVYGCMGVWVYGCMSVWVHGCMVYVCWISGCMGVWVCRHSYHTHREAREQLENYRVEICVVCRACQHQMRSR